VRFAQVGDPVIPNTRLYLVIDQGGHASRASLHEENGRRVAAASVAIATYHPTADRVEHDPEEMAASVANAIAGVLREAGTRTVVAAALATQRSSVVCWDRRNGLALSPVISWQDRRAAGWLRRLENNAAEIRQRSGLPLSPHYGAAKLRWCLEHLPAVQEAWRAGHLAWGPLASFLIYRLTEERTLCADPANGSRTLLWNLDSADWDPVLTHLFGVPIETLPPCVPTRHAFGHIAGGGRRIPLILASGDQSAALFAVNGNPCDRVLINLGTGAFMQQALAQRPPPSSLLTSLAYQDADTRLYALEGTVNGAGSALAWIAEKLGLAKEELIRNLPEWLTASTAPPLFLNGVGGLGTPYLIPGFRSSFVGDYDGRPAEQCVAVIESIVFLLQINLDEAARIVAPPADVIICGGLSRLEGLCQRLADLSGRRLYRPRDHEATAQGLARLLTASERTAQTDSDQATASIFLPRPNQALQERYRNWRRELETHLIPPK
jgi:glycerol kinase